MSGNFNKRRALEDRCSGILLLFTLLLYTTEGLNTEGQYLLKLKSSLHDESNHLANWKSAAETPCGWTGVNCTFDYNPVVWCLDLSSMILSGTLNPSIGGLTHLTYLNLAYNGLMGNIPHEIGNCSSLEI